MKLAGFLLMPAGFFISVSAAVLLHTFSTQTGFCLAGFAIEVVGFVLVAREHLPSRAATARERSTWRAKNDA